MKILTWNIMNDAATMNNRLPMILSAIQKIHPDIICMQEVLDTHVAIMKTELDHIGYAMNNGSNAQRTDRAYMAWRTDAFMPTNESTIDTIDATMMRFVSANDTHHGTVIISYHGLWGALNPKGRIDEVLAINEASEIGHGFTEDGDQVYLCGDFNAQPMEKPIRILKGMEDEPIYWSDSYDNPIVSGLDHGTSLKTGVGADTATRAGIIMPEYLPCRRIDYIMHKGWSYGKRGGFKSLTGYTDDMASDHAALIAETI